MVGKEVDVTIKGLWKIIDTGDFEYWLTTTHVGYLLTFGLLIAFALYVKHRVSKFDEVPKGFQNLIEFIVDMLDSFTKSAMGKNSKFFMNYIGTIFAFILVSNWSGLLGIRPVTADYATPLGLALITFGMIQYNNMKSNGIKAYFKGFIQPLPFLLPLNIIGEISTPVSMSLRLFCNILGGTILIGLFYSLIPRVLTFVIPAALHAYLDIFAGGLQAFIFAMLTMVFVSNVMGDAQEN